MTDHDRLRMQLAQAYSRAVHPDVRDHVRAALLELDADVPTPLAECRVCGRVGIPERIQEHDCPPSPPLQ